MTQPTITFIINKIPYALNASNVEAIKKMPSADRQQLMALLEAIKREESAAQPATTPTATPAASNQTSSPQHIDPDALMAQLAIEDRFNQNLEFTKQSLYKWIAGVVGVLLLLILIS